MSEQYWLKEHPQRPELTTTVTADRETGTIWGGVWGDPESKENQQMLVDIRGHTRKDYTIMSFFEAENIRMANRQKANLKTKKEEEL
jgi:hypothetical protein